MFKRMTQEHQQLKQINSQITGIKMNLDLSEQSVSNGIAGINALRSQEALLQENFRTLQKDAKIVTIESMYQIKNSLIVVADRLSKALTIYNGVRTERDNFKKHYDKAIVYRDKFIEENLSDAKVLMFQRKENGKEPNSRGDSSEDR